MTNHYLLKNNWPSDRNYCLTRVTLKNYFHWKVLISRNVFKEGSLTKRGKVLLVMEIQAFILALLLELALQNERQTWARRILSSPPFRLWMPSGRLEPARRMPRRKTADLYFFVEGAAGWPVHELRAVCVPYTGCVFH